MHLWKKDEALRKLCGDLRIEPKQVAVVGDHVNDLPLFNIAGLRFACKPKDERMKRSADYIIDDLREIPLILKRI